MGSGVLRNEVKDLSGILEVRTEFREIQNLKLEPVFGAFV